MLLYKFADTGMCRLDDVGVAYLCVFIHMSACVFVCAERVCMCVCVCCVCLYMDGRGDSFRFFLLLYVSENKLYACMHA